MFTQYTLYDMILLYYYAETKEMIYESVNLKGVVYEPKQFLIKMSLNVNNFLSVYHQLYRFCKRWPDLLYSSFSEL